MSKIAQDILLVPRTSPTFPSGKSWRTVTILYRKIKTGSLGCEVTSGRRGEFTQPDLRFFLDIYRRVFAPKPSRWDARRRPRP